jgi:hypothetical protein
MITILINTDIVVGGYDTQCRSDSAAHHKQVMQKDISGS